MKRMPFPPGGDRGAGDPSHRERRAQQEHRRNRGRGAAVLNSAFSLVERAGLVNALSGKKQLTVFAPTNAAFKKVPKKTLNALLADNKLLRKVLLYHVVAGKVPAAKVVEAQRRQDPRGGQGALQRQGQERLRQQHQGDHPRHVRCQQRDRPRDQPGADPADLRLRAGVRPGRYPAGPLAVMVDTRTMIKRLLDEAMDWTVLPGFSEIGYRARERLVPRGPLPARRVARSILTGATSGIGEAACVDLARGGATVHMLALYLGRGREALERVADRSGSSDLPAAPLRRIQPRLGTRVRRRASSPRATPLDVLIHNADVPPPQRTHTDEGFELTFATNVLGPFLLTALLLAGPTQVGALPRHQHLLRRHVTRRRSTSTTSQLEDRGLRRDPLLRPHQARRGDPQRGVGQAPRRRLGNRQLGPPRLGRDRRRRGIPASLQPRHGPAAPRPRRRRRHHRLARRLPQGGQHQRRVLARPPHPLQAPRPLDPREREGPPPPVRRVRAFQWACGGRRRLPRGLTELSLNA